MNIIDSIWFGTAVAWRWHDVLNDAKAKKIGCQFQLEKLAVFILQTNYPSGRFFYQIFKNKTSNRLIIRLNT